MEDPILKHAHTVTSQITHIVASLYLVMFFFKGRAFGKNVSTIRLKIINKWGQNYFAPEQFSRLLGRREKEFQGLGEKCQPI
jgi:hypothetical protein